MNRGYIAITTTIILSILMLILATSLGSINVLSRSGVADFYNKRTSFYVARSCLEYARLQLSLNLNYLGSESRQVGNFVCSLQLVETLGQNKILKARSQINGATTNLKLTINGSTLDTVSLEELVNF